MYHERHHHTEALVDKLNDQAFLIAYKGRFDDYIPSILPRLLGGILVSLGNIVYGRNPSYLKFRAVEVIARVPYQSWVSATYTLLTMFYSNEQKAVSLSKMSAFAQIAQDNETMHVVVISHLAQQEGKHGIFRHTLIPLFFALFYFWVAYLLYLLKPKYALELNYLFEQHAFDQYDLFLKQNGDALKKKLVKSDFLDWYGRKAVNQHEFFRSVRNDEIIHRNRSIEEIERV